MAVFWRRMEPMQAPDLLNQLVAVVALAAWQAAAYAMLACAIRAAASRADELVVIASLLLFGLGALTATAGSPSPAVAVVLVTAAALGSAAVLGLVAAGPPAWRLLVTDPEGGADLGVPLDRAALATAGAALLVVPAATVLDGGGSIAWVPLICALALAPVPAVLAAATAAVAEVTVPATVPGVPSGVAGITTAMLAVLALSLRQDAPA